MDVSFDEDQQALRAGLRDVLSDQSTSVQVRRAAASATGADLDLYRLLIEFGIAELPGPVEVGIAMEECGRTLVPAPVLSTVGVCAPALIAAGGDRADELLAGLRDGSARPMLAVDVDPLTLEGGTVRGVLPLVPDAHVATHLVFAAAPADSAKAEPSLVVVDAADCPIEQAPTMDATRRLATATLEDVPVRVIGEHGQARRALEAAHLEGSVAVAHELVGVGQATLDMAVRYANMREQFGKPIGTYQAISHRCADMFVALESARSHAYYAAWAVQSGSAQRELAAAQAKASASEGAVFCAQSNIQVHGGIGFTWEHDAHLYLKRARAGAALLGTPTAHKRRIADLIGV